MKKAIMLGAALLISSSAILIANNNNNSAAEECCDRTKCEQGVCKPSDKCENPDECCSEE